MRGTVTETLTRIGEWQGRRPTQLGATLCAGVMSLLLGEDYWHEPRSKRRGDSDRVFRQAGTAPRALIMPTYSREHRRVPPHVAVRSPAPPAQ